MMHANFHRPWSYLTAGMAFLLMTAGGATAGVRRYCANPSNKIENKIEN